MADSNPESWTDTMSGRERVRHAVELLEEPTLVQEIADRADVSRTTADDELQRLESDDWVVEKSDFSCGRTTDTNTAVWIESDRSMLVGWHQDEMHDDLGPVQLQVNDGSTPIDHQPAVLVVDKRSRHIM